MSSTSYRKPSGGQPEVWDCAQSLPPADRLSPVNLSSLTRCSRLCLRQKVLGGEKLQFKVMLTGGPTRWAIGPCWPSAFKSKVASAQRPCGRGNEKFTVYGPFPRSSISSLSLSVCISLRLHIHVIHIYIGIEGRRIGEEKRRGVF